MAIKIDIANVGKTLYKFPIPNYTSQFIWGIVLELPYTHKELEDAGGFYIYREDPYENPTGSFLGLTSLIPFWFYGVNNTIHETFNILLDDDYPFAYNSHVDGNFSEITLSLYIDNKLWVSNTYSRQINLSTGEMLSYCLIAMRYSDGDFVSENSAAFGMCAITNDSGSQINLIPSQGVKGWADPSSFAFQIALGSERYPLHTTIDALVNANLHKIFGTGKVWDQLDPNPGGGDSKPGGGGGDGDIGGDTNPDDGLPTISALDSGLLTAYNPTVAELQSLGRFLWSDSFDISTFKKLFNDPFDTLLGLSVVPVKPTTSGTKSIMFGNMDSGVSAPVVANQWVPKDMGSVTLNEVWHGALDYAPSTGVTIYLPFIGMRQLNVNDVMGSTLHLIYKFDVLTGACIAQIYVNHSSQGNKDDGFSWHKDQGLLYEFIGQCAENIPLASQDFTNTIRAAIGGVSVAAGAAASVATGNPALGMAALTVGMANSGMQASTPTVERGGHLSGSASIMGYGQPFLIVERPHQCKPSRYYALRGVPSQVYTSKLASCTGFTQITANNNLHIAGASDTELTELQNLLVAGVYFPDKKR